MEGQKALIEWSPLWFDYVGKEAIIRKVFVDKEGFVTVGRHSFGIDWDNECLTISAKGKVASSNRTSQPMYTLTILERQL